MVRSRKTPIKKITVAKEKLAVIHICTQKEQIAHLLENTSKLSIIITGNGNPEHGLCRQVALIGERQTAVLNTLKDVDNKIKEIYQTHDTILTQITSLQTKEEAKVIAEKLEITKKRDRNWKIATISSIILTAIGIFAGLYFGIRRIEEGQTSIKNEVQDQTIQSLKKNNRGSMIIQLPSVYKPDTIRIDSIINSITDNKK
jgi:hypothetical protein